jgi:hypothetical protein
MGQYEKLGLCGRWDEAASELKKSRCPVGRMQADSTQGAMLEHMASCGHQVDRRIQKVCR